jgi:hypothetical protein
MENTHSAAIANAMYLRMRIVISRPILRKAPATPDGALTVSCQLKNQQTDESSDSEKNGRK